MNVGHFAIAFVLISFGIVGCGASSGTSNVVKDSKQQDIDDYNAAIEAEAKAREDWK